jgi:hypothetical protein
MVVPIGQEFAVLAPSVFVLAFALAGPERPVNSHRTDPPPKEWKIDKINEGLPLSWEKGAVHLLAWEVIEDDRPHRYTQILVLKRFDQPTTDGGYKWVLAHLCLRPRDDEWRGPMRIPGPLPIGQRMPKLTNAQLFGSELYKDPPNDDQIQTMLQETRWKPDLGAREVFNLSGKRTCTTKLAAGGVSPEAWMRSLGRKMPPFLFPELTKSSVEK